MTLAFIACVERGYLEEQTLLLCRSIRRYAGRFSASAIYTFQPRCGTEVTPRTLALFDQLGVFHNTETLNTDFEDYGYGNKIFACARAEETLSEDVLVFLDSDTIMTGEPVDLDLPDEVYAAAKPAHSFFLNSTGPEDPNDAYWQKVYEASGIEARPFVETELGRRVRAYFSSGLVAVRREAGLFRQWKKDFLRLVNAELIPEGTGVSRMDEVSLAALLTRAFDRVRILDGRYNYLIYRRSQLGSPWREARLEDLVHVHYRHWFNEKNFLRQVEPPLDPTSEILQWLDQYLPFDDRAIPFARSGKVVAV